MPLLKNDASALVLPDNGGTPINAQMDVIKDSVRQIQTDYGNKNEKRPGTDFVS
jgi:hypothetical protein